MNVLEQDLVPIEDVAKEIGMDVKRLRGYIHRNGITDPIGSLAMDQVYGWSCKALMARLAAASTSTAAAIPGQAVTHEAGEVGK